MEANPAAPASEGTTPADCPPGAAAEPPVVGTKRPLEGDASAAPAPSAGDLAAGEAPAAASQEASGEDEAPLKKQQVGWSPAKGASLSETVYRLLAPSKHAGYVIGKGGSQIKELREHTGARIKVMEGVMGSDERPIVISSKSNGSFDECPAQAALMAIYRKLLEAEAIHGTQEPGKEPLIRALVAQTQAGSLIGKAGVFIKQVREESGADVRVLKPEELPLCALANDRVVQISGPSEKTETALKTVAMKLYENPPREAPGGAPPALLAALGQQQPLLGAASGMHIGPHGTQAIYPGMHQQQGWEGRSATTRMITVPNQHVGIIIGARGANIKDIREKSGAQVKVHQQTGLAGSSSLRQVEITGLPHQISLAESMITAAWQRMAALAAAQH